MLAAPVMPVGNTSEPAGELVAARISHYWPPWGGPNCSRYVAGQCVSAMASGLPWALWVGRAAACPPEWPFWTRLVLPGGEEFTCLDRGGAIRYGADGLPWVDLLVETPPLPFGSIVSVTVVWPE